MSDIDRQPASILGSPPEDRQEPEEPKTHPIFYRRSRDTSGYGRGSNMDVLESFLAGTPAKGRAAKVPGGRRLSAERDSKGGLNLFSYNTLIAHREANGDISVSERRYSTTTSKWQNKLKTLMSIDHYEPTGETRTHEARVPGRWGGWGIPWHPTGWETLPFTHHRKRG